MKKQQMRLSNKVNRLQTRVNIKGQKIQNLEAKKAMIPAGKKPFTAVAPSDFNTFNKEERQFNKRARIQGAIERKQANMQKIGQKIQKIAPRITDPNAKIVPAFSPAKVSSVGRSASSSAMALAKKAMPVYKPATMPMMKKAIQKAPMIAPKVAASYKSDKDKLMMRA